MNQNKKVREHARQVKAMEKRKKREKKGQYMVDGKSFSLKVSNRY